MPTCPIFTQRRLAPVPTLAPGEPAITTASQTPTQKPTSTPTEAPTGSPTFTLTSEPTSTPTPTLIPSLTETLTPSPSPTYAVLRGEVLELSNCRYGPGAMYLYKYALIPGSNLEVFGRTDSGAWILVRAGDDTASPIHLLEAWVCQTGELVFIPTGTDSNSAIIEDQEGCSVPSHARVYGVEKHGYTRPVEVPWPAR